MEFKLWLEKSTEFQVLKKNKKPLDAQEKEEAMKAGAVWHFSDSPTCAIFQTKNSKGEKFYFSNTHRAYAKDKTLKGAIRSFKNIVEPSS